MCAGNLVGSEGASGEREHHSARSDEKWKMSDDESKADDSARGRSHRSDEPADSNPTSPAGVNVCVEPHYDSRAIDRQNCGGDLASIH